MKEILRGWKQIEDYTGLSRYGLNRNCYPVRREERGSVYAIKSELDAYMRRQSSIAFQKTTQNNAD